MTDLLFNHPWSIRDVAEIVIGGYQGLISSERLPGTISGAILIFKEFPREWAEKIRDIEISKNCRSDDLDIVHLGCIDNDENHTTQFTYYSANEKLCFELLAQEFIEKLASDLGLEWQWGKIYSEKILQLQNCTDTWWVTMGEFARLGGLKRKKE